MCLCVHFWSETVHCTTCQPRLHSLSMRIPLWCIEKERQTRWCACSPFFLQPLFSACLLSNLSLTNWLTSLSPTILKVFSPFLSAAMLLLTANGNSRLLLPLKLSIWYRVFALNCTQKRWSTPFLLPFSVTVSFNRPFNLLDYHHRHHHHRDTLSPTESRCQLFVSLLFTDSHYLFGAARESSSLSHA